VTAYDRAVRLPVALVVLWVVSASCSSGATEPTTTEPPEPTATTTTAAATTSTTQPTTTETSATSTTAPEGGLAPALQAHVDWFVALLNGAQLDEADYLDRFAQVFLSQVPVDQFRQITGEVGAAGDLWKTVETEYAAPVGAVVRIAPSAGEPAILLNFTIDADGKINSLLVQPAEAPTLDDPPATIDEAAARLRTMGTLGFVVADNDEDVCTVIDGEAPAEPVPLGSMFKLYVLSAVVDAVAAGSIAWDQAVTIEDRYRSLPSGIVQNDPAGATRTVRELAELMISISDNTATDHLLGLVGRSAVEEAQRTYAHATPELNEPFLSTRELFLLKLDGATRPGTPGPVGKAYLSGDTTERRAVLEALVGASVADLDLAIWTQPIAVDELEWFASPLDLCRVLVLLQEDEEAQRILEINPGIPDETGLWSSIGFKGGSEPGVLGLAWYLTAPDGSTRVVAGTVWNSEQVLDETEASLLFGALRDLAP
jgi:hypothetical protein